MKVIIARLLVLAVAYFVSGCASQDELSSTAHHSAAEGTVPGETVSDGRELAPGTGAQPNAGVRW